MKILIKNKPFILLTLAITTLFFVISGVQIWATYYFMNALNIEPVKANYYFVLVAFTSPVSGAFMSGWVIDWLGGFYAPIALPFCLMIGSLGIGCAWLVPFSDSWQLVMVYLWVLLFCGAMVLPICTGVSLTKVEPEMRPRANSIANFSYNLLGWFPGPAVYGFAVWLHGKPNSGWGMGSLMMTSTMMAVFVLLAVIADPNVGWHNAFKRLKHGEKGQSEKAESEHPEDFESTKDDKENMQAVDL